MLFVFSSIGSLRKTESIISVLKSRIQFDMSSLLLLSDLEHYLHCDKNGPAREQEKYETIKSHKDPGEQVMKTIQSNRESDKIREHHHKNV